MDKHQKMRVGIVLITLVLASNTHLVFASDCRDTGCQPLYKCMADGECIHSSMSTQEYCNSGYREHGFAYDVVNPESCSRIGLVCNEIEKKCRELPSKGVLSEERINECIRLQRMCLQCRGDCELKNNVNGIKNIIYSVAAGITILVVIVSAIQLISSEEESVRSNTKKTISYSIVALILLIIAVEVVEYVWASFALANTYAPIPKTALLENNESCRSSHQCMSQYCNNGVCCDSGQCGLNKQCYDANYKRPDDGAVCSGGRWKNENNKPCTEDINCISGCCIEKKCSDCSITTTTSTTTKQSTTTTSTTTTTTSTTISVSENTININAYLAEGVDETQYKSFLGKIESYFQSKGLSIKLNLLKVGRYTDSKNNDPDCPMYNQCPQDADLNVCVGPGEGWMWGCAIGCNTNPPFGFDTDTGIIAEAHEFIHFLGYQDLYCLPSGVGGEGMPQEWLENDIMGKNPYVSLSRSKMAEIEKKIVEFNIKQLNSAGRSSIYYSSGGSLNRMRNNALLNVKTGLGNTVCNIYKFSGYESCEGVQSSVYKKVTSDASGTISFSSGWSDGYKIVCGSKTFWLPSPVFDECFIGNNYRTFSLCNIKCETSDRWCEYESSS